MNLEFKTLDIRKIGKEEVNSVLARELYKDLYKGKDISAFNKKIVDNFAIDQDYIVADSSADIIVTTDTAKSLAMMSMTPKGKEIRQYFINVEKIAKDVLGEKRLELELKKMENNVELDYIKGKLEIASMLQGLGANFDPIALANEGKFVSKLPQDIGNVLTDAMSDIRVGIRTFSATHLLAENGVDILTRDFNSAMILAGLMEEYNYRGKIHRRFTNKFNWYGYNQDSSSIKELPYLVKYYEDRLVDLVTLLQNEGYID